MLTQATNRIENAFWDARSSSAAAERCLGRLANLHRIPLLIELDPTNARNRCRCTAT
jgi:hypothetical protein